MKRSDISELFYIAPIANLPSIVKLGILSHQRCSCVKHESVAMAEIQERRKDKQIPGARKLHEYANLYFDAHNPMLCKVQNKNDQICVLRVNKDVLDLPGVIIADQNASKSWARFYPVSEGVKALDKDRVFATYWTHPDDPFEERVHKAEKCAEVLVPDRVDSRFLHGAFVANPQALSAFKKLSLKLPVALKSELFF
jgi:hypothetical protein